MKRLNLKNIKNFIVISDVHLRNADDKLTQTFIHEINQIKNIDALFLLGDIFDFIAGPVPFFLNYWKDVFDALQNLKNRNVQIYFTEGNHDFGFEHFQSPRFLECFTQCGDFEISLNHPLHGNILLKHGDDVVCKASYHPFRDLVKSKWFQKINLFLFSGSWMNSIFTRYAKFSRSQDSYRVLDNNFMNQKIAIFLKKYHPLCDIFIMGHVHKNVDYFIDTTKSIRVLIGKAWFDVPNFLKVDEKEICRYSIQPK